MINHHQRFTLNVPPSDPPAGGRGVLDRLVGGDGLLHFVVDLQDDSLGAVFAMLNLVSLDNKVSQ